MTMGTQKSDDEGKMKRIKDLWKVEWRLIAFSTPANFPSHHKIQSAMAELKNTWVFFESTFLTNMTIVPKVLLPTINYSTNNHNDTIKLRHGYNQSSSVAVISPYSNMPS
jgi:hypothetical protein